MDTDQRQLPHTRATIEEDLRGIGLSAGDTVLIHTSLKQIGYTVGGPQAVIQALMNVVGGRGTIVMPAFSNEAGYADPLDWKFPPPPRDRAEIIRTNLPPFDPATTPSVGMGVIAELFRTYPEVRRNNHPIVSYAAWGKNADYVVNGHTLEMMDGENSPLARIYDLDGKVLLLGVDYSNCTSIHLATHRQNSPPMTTESVPTWDESGQIHWNRYPDVLNPGMLDPSIQVKKKIRFTDIGSAFEATGALTMGKVGNAESRLISQPSLVDFATEYFNRHPYGDAALDT